MIPTKPLSQWTNEEMRLFAEGVVATAKSHGIPLKKRNSLNIKFWLYRFRRFIKLVSHKSISIFRHNRL